MSKTIIVVDDSKLSRMHIRGIVARNKPDWTVVEAANSGELYGKLDDGELHVAIIDFNMPGDTGLDAAARLKAAKPDIHIAIITANAQDAVVSGIRALGAAFMPKPLDEEQVARFLAAADLPRPRAAGATPGKAG